MLNLDPLTSLTQREMVIELSEVLYKINGRNHPSPARAILILSL
ncbi:hypothetical protein [Erwinia phyllosphaerae]|nr:hypothetical protein [Erwinia phyllosphaerae]